MTRPSKPRWVVDVAIPLRMSMTTSRPPVEDDSAVPRMTHEADTRPVRYARGTEIPPMVVPDEELG